VKNKKLLIYAILCFTLNNQAEALSLNPSLKALKGVLGRFSNKAKGVKRVSNNKDGNTKFGPSIRTILNNKKSSQNKHSSKPKKPIYNIASSF
jgi:hypothetical protein